MNIQNVPWMQSWKVCFDPKWSKGFQDVGKVIDTPRCCCNLQLSPLLLYVQLKLRSSLRSSDWKYLKPPLFGQRRDVCSWKTKGGPLAEAWNGWSGETKSTFKTLFFHYSNPQQALGKEPGCVTNQTWSKWIIHHRSYCKCSLFPWHFWVREHFTAVMRLWGGEERRREGVCRRMYPDPLRSTCSHHLSASCFCSWLRKALGHLSFPCFI